MPTYEYSCEICHHKFEKSCKMSEMKRTLKCPVCKDRATLQVSKGVTFGDEAAWLNDEQTRGAIQDDSEIRRNPSLSRTEYKQILKSRDIVERG